MMTIRRKCRVAAMIPLALLVLFEVGKCGANDASARFMEVVGTADCGTTPSRSQGQGDP